MCYPGARIELSPRRPIGEEQVARQHSQSERTTSDSHVRQPACKIPKLRRPCFRKARGAPGFPIPSLTRGMLPHKCEGSGAPKGAGNIDTPCGARPVRWAFTSRRSTAAFSLDLETAFCERTGAAFTERP